MYRPKGFYIIQPNLKEKYMKKKSIILFAALISVCSLSFASSLKSMSKDQVMKALEDKTITTIPMAMLGDQLLQDSFIGYFGKEGKLIGKFETKPANEPQTDEGTWAVKSDGLACATWQHWNNTKPVCVYFYDTKNALLLVGENKLHSAVLKDNIKAGNQLTG